MITVSSLNRHRLRTKNRIIPRRGTPRYHCYRLVQMFTTFLTFPIQCNFHSKRGSWSFSKQQPWQSWETLSELENAGPGLYKALTAWALSHLCLSPTLRVCVWWEVMVLLRRSGFWDASLTLRPGSISDHFNGQEHGGCYPPPESGLPCVSQAALGPMPTNTLTPSYRPLTKRWIWHPSLKPGPIFQSSRA